MTNTNKNNKSSNLYDDGNIPEIDLPQDKKSNNFAKSSSKPSQKNKPDKTNNT